MTGVRFKSACRLLGKVNHLPSDRVTARQSDGLYQPEGDIFEALLLNNFITLSSVLIRKRDFESDLEYLFKHALTQEVAYSGLLRSKRQELHRRVGQAMEKLLGERSREYAESIAYHFQNSDAPQRAAPYLLIAGKK